MSLTSDLEYAIKDAGGNTVVDYSGVRSYGILDYSDGLEILESGGAAQTRVTTLLIVTSAFAKLRDDGVIAIVSSEHPSAQLLVGVRLRVDRIAPQDDGATTLLSIARAA